MQAIEKVAAPLKLGGAELMPALLKLGSVFTVASGTSLTKFVLCNVGQNELMLLITLRQRISR